MHGVIFKIKKHGISQAIPVFAFLGTVHPVISRSAFLQNIYVAKELNGSQIDFPSVYWPGWNIQ